MALPIRDGNQSLTTLSTILVSNAHIPAHTVVSLGTQAITDIATAVSGVELGPNTLNALENITVTLGQVTITGGLTDTQLRASAVTIAGVVTANVASSSNVGIGFRDSSGDLLNVDNIGSNLPVMVYNSAGEYAVGGDGGNQLTGAVGIGHNSNGQFNIVGENSPLPISGTVTANLANVTTNDPWSSNLAVKVIGAGPEGLILAGIDFNGNPANIYEGGMIPIAGRDGSNSIYKPIPLNDGADAVNVNVVTTNGNLPISGTVTANNLSQDIYDGANDWRLTRSAIHLSVGAGEWQAVGGENGSENPLPISGTVSLGNGVGEGWLTNELQQVYSYEDRVIVGIHPTYNTIQGTVTIGSALPAGTNRIGVVTIGAGTVTIGAGTAQIGSVTASLAAGQSIYVSNPPSVLARLSVQLVDSAGTGNYGTDGSPLKVSGTVTVGNTVTIANIQGTTVTTSNFTSTAPSTVLAEFNATREVLTVFNEGAGLLYVSVGTSCTTIGYQVRLSSGDYYEAPLNQASITHSAVFATAGTARVTQVS